MRTSPPHGERTTGAREPCFDERCRVIETLDLSARPTSVPVVATGAMTPGVFIAKWWAVELNERSASQSHFIDLCRLLGEPTPTDADPPGEWYCFERGARKDNGGDGWADVWKRPCATGDCDAVVRGDAARCCQACSGERRKVTGSHRRVKDVRRGQASGPQQKRRERFRAARLRR